MDVLTQREKEVARLLAQGKSTQEIATELCIAPRTVKMHLDNARGKADCTNRLQLAIKILKNTSQ